MHAVGRRHQDLADRFGVGAIFFRQADHQRKAALTLVNFAHPRSAQRLYDVQHVAPRDSIARQGLFVDRDSHDRGMRKLVGNDVFRAGYRADGVRDLFGVIQQLVVILAEDLNSQVAADACDHLVDPLFDRLSEEHRHAGHPVDDLFHLRDQFVLRAQVSTDRAA